MKNKKVSVLVLVEGAVAIALAFALSFFELEIGANGGSVSLAVVPIIVFAVHSGGVGWGVIAGLALGLLKQFASGEAYYGWQSMVLDYLLAYAAVGVAGITYHTKRLEKYALGAIIGCVLRFAFHVVSGVWLWGDWKLDTVLGISTPTVLKYSLVYNASYMVPVTLIAVILCPILGLAVDTALKHRKR